MECLTVPPAELVSGTGIDSEHGPTLGGELPRIIYFLVIGAYGWFLLSAWFAFSTGREVDFALSQVSMIFLVLLGLVGIAFHVAWSRSRRHVRDVRQFLSSNLETATGPLSGGDASLQLLIVPASLALAGTLLAIVYRLTI